MRKVRRASNLIFHVLHAEAFEVISVVERLLAENSEDYSAEAH
jgi:hypothetical protein